MRQNPHVRICGGPGSATTLVYPTSIRAEVAGQRLSLERGVVHRGQNSIERVVFAHDRACPPQYGRVRNRPSSVPLHIGFLAQMYARFSPQQVVHAGGRGCGCARGRYSAGKSSVAQSTAACAAPLLVGGLLGGSQLDRKVLRRWHSQGDEP